MGQNGQSVTDDKTELNCLQIIFCETRNVPHMRKINGLSTKVNDQHRSFSKKLQLKSALQNFESIENDSYHVKIANFAKMPSVTESE